MTDLPPGWEWATLEDVAEIVQGQSPPGSSYNDKGLGVPFFQGKAEFGKIFAEVCKWTTSPQKTASAGDILLSIRAPVGPTNIAPVDCSVGRGLAAIKSCVGIEQRYLFWVLRGTASILAEKSTGSTFSAVSGKQIRGHPIPVPPLAEQRRIVAALEGHLSRLDAGKESVASGKAKLRSWWASTVESAVCADTERYVPPSHWEWTTVGELAKVGTGATPLRSRKDYYEPGTVPWVTSTQLNEPFIDSARQHISEKALAETSVKLYPPGTLLVAMYGEGQTRGRCSELRTHATINQACAAIQFDSQYESRRPWVKLLLEASYDRNRRLAAGEVQPNLNLGIVRNIPVPLPSLDEQERILAVVDEQRAVMQRLTHELSVADSRAESLRRLLLTQAFSGQLAAQDPNDEPASELLARIRAERAAQQPAKRSRKASAKSAKSSTSTASTKAPPSGEVDAITPIQQETLL